MNILYIGSGFVGACSAAVSASSGHSVLVYDIDENKIKMLGSGDRDTIESCLYEKGLGDLLVRNSERIQFTTDYGRVEAFLDGCDAVFMCLPTPEIGETGESNLTYYFEAGEKLAGALLKRNPSSLSATPGKSGEQSKYVVIINKSTVPIDMVNKTQEIMDKAGVKNYGIVSNPEFLVEGKAISGSLKPDRIVVGAWKQEDFEIMRKIYERFYNSPTVKYIEVNPKEAAAGKLLANFYLTLKLSACFDVIGRTCESFSDLEFESIRKILSTDDRIGSWGLFDSLYAGGSCLTKDIRSLTHQLKSSGAQVSLIEEVYGANKRQLQSFIARAKKEVLPQGQDKSGFNWTGKNVALLGTAFKRDTNDIRNSASIEIMRFLFSENIAKIKIYDPAASDNFKILFPESEQVKYVNKELEAINQVDVVIISTDWPQFRELTSELLQLSNRPLIMDGRRILSHKYKELQENGYDIIAVGSAFIKGIDSKK